MEKAKSTGNFSAALPLNPEFDREEEEEDMEDNTKNSQTAKVISGNSEEPLRYIKSRLKNKSRLIDLFTGKK